MQQPGWNLMGRSDLGGLDGHDSLDGFKSDDQLDGGPGDDFLKGGNDDDTLEGGSGDDTLNGNKGHDHLKGNNGADVFILSKGTDVIADYDRSEGDQLFIDDSLTFIEKENTILITDAKGNNVGITMVLTEIDRSDITSIDTNQFKPKTDDESCLKTENPDPDQGIDPNFGVDPDPADGACTKDDDCGFPLPDEIIDEIHDGVDEIIEDGDVDPEFGQDPILTPDQRDQLKNKIKALLNQIPVDPNFGVDPDPTNGACTEDDDCGFPLPDEIIDEIHDGVDEIIEDGDVDPEFGQDPILTPDRRDQLKNKIKALLNQIPVDPNFGVDPDPADGACTEDDDCGFPLPDEIIDEIHDGVDEIIEDGDVDPEFGQDPILTPDQRDQLKNKIGSTQSDPR